MYVFGCVMWHSIHIDRVGDYTHTMLRIESPPTMIEYKSSMLGLGSHLFPRWLELQGASEPKGLGSCNPSSGVKMKVLRKVVALTGTQQLDCLQLHSL